MSNSDWHNILRDIDPLISPYKGMSNFQCLSIISSHHEISLLEQMKFNPLHSYSEESKINYEVLMHYAYLNTLRTHFSKNISADQHILFVVFAEIFEKYPKYQENLWQNYAQYLIFRLKNSAVKLEKVQVIEIIKKVAQLRKRNFELEDIAWNELVSLIQDFINGNFFIDSENIEEDLGFIIFKKLPEIWHPKLNLKSELEKILKSYLKSIMDLIDEKNYDDTTIQNCILFLSSLPSNIIFSPKIAEDIKALSSVLYSLLYSTRPQSHNFASFYNKRDSSKSKAKVTRLNDLIMNVRKSEPLDVRAAGRIICGDKVSIYNYNNKYILKEIKIQIDESNVHGIYKEIEACEMMNKLNERCECLIKYFGCFFLDKSVYLVLEIGGNSLSEARLRNSCLIEGREVSLRIMKGIVNCLILLKNENFFHCDIKPSNILIDESNFKPKLIDFGISLKLKQDQDYHNSIIKARGTTSYCSPQIFQRYLPTEHPNIQNRKINFSSEILPHSFRYDIEKSDIFSLGLVFAELCSPDSFSGFSDPKKYSELQSKLDQINNRKIIPLLKSMLKLDPTDRPTFEKVFDSLNKI